jgi:radical SAM protein with 4Fe4S-binding SPASM domain
MNDFTAHSQMLDFPLWEKTGKKRIPLSFDLEITARCNNDCRHCYINLPAGDEAARRRELTLSEIDSIASQAVKMGALWCLLTGGEPLLRRDFSEIYLLLKKKGLLVTVFTNACLVTDAHVKLFQTYPPRNLEVTVYGASAETYERVTRKPGSFAAFRRGLALLVQGGVKVRLKAMALRSNVHEMEATGSFCRSITEDFYRFDPLLNLRHDGNPARNAEILSERLTPAEIVAVEQVDPERSAALQEHCDQLINQELCGMGCSHLFHCEAGVGAFSVGYDGRFRLCSSLNRADCTYDLRQGSLSEAWTELVPRVRGLESDRQEFREQCRSCPIINLCMWCPAIADLETGRMDGRIPYYCQVAHARAESLRNSLAG